CFFAGLVVRCGELRRRLVLALHQHEPLWRSLRSTGRCGRGRVVSLPGVVHRHDLRVVRLVTTYLYARGASGLCSGVVGGLDEHGMATRRAVLGLSVVEHRLCPRRRPPGWMGTTPG